MTRNSSIREKNFDRESEFIVNKEFLMDGEAQIPGKSFDKSKCTTRLLRQLFEQKRIELKDDDGSLSKALEKAPLKGKTVEEALREKDAVFNRKVKIVSQNGSDHAKDLKLKQFGRGRWAVMAGNKRLSEIVSKKKAQAALKEKKDAA